MPYSANMKTPSLPMLSPILVFVLLVSVVFRPQAFAQDKSTDAAAAPHDLAMNLAKLCNPAQKAELIKDYADPVRTDWHYIPKATRKGLDLRKATGKQRAAALALLGSCLSKQGFETTKQIMALEGLLAMLEKAPERRDPNKYYVTLFGEPAERSVWGFSFEGHHLSCNFSFEKGKLVCATPFFLAADPDRVVKSGDGHAAVGSRILDEEQDLAVELLQSLNADKANLGKPDRHMKEGGKAQAHERRRIGVAGKEMNAAQKKKLDALVARYLSHLPADHAADIRKQMKTDELSFAWHGGNDAKQPHRYQIVGPTHAIVYYNTQSDSVGTKVNHAHAILRTIGGDFNIQEK